MLNPQLNRLSPSVVLVVWDPDFPCRSVVNALSEIDERSSRKCAALLGIQHGDDKA